MKRNIIGLVLIIAAFVSVTSGCVVREGYGHPHHHDPYYYRGY